MGDRCYYSVKIHPLDWHLMYDLLDFPKDLSTVKAVDAYITRQEQVLDNDTKRLKMFIDELSLENDGTISVEGYEANYGHYDEWIEAAQRGARFRSYHSYGSEYGPGSAIGLGFKHYYVELAHGDESMFVRVNSNGEPNLEELEKVKEYLEAEQKFENSLKLLPNTWEEIIPLCHNKMPDG